MLCGTNSAMAACFYNRIIIFLMFVYQDRYIDFLTCDQLTRPFRPRHGTTRCRDNILIKKSYLGIPRWISRTFETLFWDRERWSRDVDIQIFKNNVGCPKSVTILIWSESLTLKLVTMQPLLEIVTHQILFQLVGQIHIKNHHTYTYIHHQIQLAVGDMTMSGWNPTISLIHPSIYFNCCCD